MARRGHYNDFRSKHPDLEVIKSQGTHPCWGAVLNADSGDDTWVLTRSPQCVSVIRPRDFYIDCRILPENFKQAAAMSGQRWTMCVHCAIRFYSEHITGPYADHLRGPVDPELVQKVLDNLKKTVVSLT